MSNKFKEALKSLQKTINDVLKKAPDAKALRKAAESSNLAGKLSGGLKTEGKKLAQNAREAIDNLLKKSPIDMKSFKLDKSSKSADTSKPADVSKPTDVPKPPDVLKPAASSIPSTPSPPIEGSRPMKFPYTFTAKMVQFPWKFYYENQWVYRYYVFGIIVTLPIFFKIHRMANSKGNKEKWAEIRRKEAMEGHSH